MDKVNRTPSAALHSLALALLVLGSIAATAARAAPSFTGDNFAKDGEVTLLAAADDLQYGHRFADALTLLDKLLTRQPQHLQARLMQARIHLAQGSLAAAQQSCQALLGQVDIAITATCLLEVAGRKNPDRLEATYTQLSRLYQQQPAGETVRHWQQQILAEQAFALGDYEAAVGWFADRDFASHPVVNQKLMLDAWLALQQPAQVLAAYTRCPQVGALPEDSVIVRLAHAERLMTAAPATSTGDESAQCWQQLARDRMQIRIARDDALHTADIGYYFAYVKLDPAQALRYAELNYQVAKEPADQRLLDAAKDLL
ncbi:tetratricopeptide repeat protein [Pseudidiomarina sp. E22-M8]|uniref:tetratricopeptide repeat protein n=1 Tax=Pseudidiomarina sp. E22-M8 TaxID=3424768 RepID=UPI00403CE48E